jgi:hypothetical protein
MGTTLSQPKMGMAEPPAAQSGADYSDLVECVPEHFVEPECLAYLVC